MTPSRFYTRFTQDITQIINVAFRLHQPATSTGAEELRLRRYAYPGQVQSVGVPAAGYSRIVGAVHVGVITASSEQDFEQSGIELEQRSPAFFHKEGTSAAMPLVEPVVAPHRVVEQGEQPDGRLVGTGGACCQIEPVPLHPTPVRWPMKQALRSGTVFGHIALDSLEIDHGFSIFIHLYTPF